MDGARPDSGRAGRAHLWLVWTAGNDRFWNEMVKPTFGTSDLLRIVASRRTRQRPAQSLEESRRRQRALLPSFGCPRSRRLRAGLTFATGCPPDPFARETLFRVKFDARGKTVPVGSYYGYPTGVVGLRLSPTLPSRKAANIGATARVITTTRNSTTTRAWSAPFRVGMCSPFAMWPEPGESPPIRRLRPGPTSARPSAPISLDVPIFYWDWEKNPRSFLYEWSNLPARYDGHLARLDRQHNNPRTMNAVYDCRRGRYGLPDRPGEVIAARLENLQFQRRHQVPDPDRLTRVTARSERRECSRTFGFGRTLGALNRVISISASSEEWMRHLQTPVGGKDGDSYRRRRRL